jgi:ABC-2 type transport system permease protein
LRNLGTVTRFTFLNRFKTKTYLVTTLIFVLLLSIMINLPFLISSLSKPGEEVKQIAILTNGSDIPQRLQSYYTNQEQQQFGIVIVDDEEFARELMKENNIEGYLVLLEEETNGFPAIQYKGENSLGMGAESRLKHVFSYLKQEDLLANVGLTEEELKAINAPVVLESVQISLSNEDVHSGKSEAEILSAFALVYVMLFLLYMGVLGYGNMVATEITAEKSSRVMEILITSVNPLKQMFGKIIGICLLGFLQVAIFLGVIVINAAFPHNQMMLKQWDIDIFASGGGLFVYFVVFYLLGYLIYATVFAGVGSLVSRTEEVSQAIMPVMMLMIAAFMISMFGLQAPNAGFIVAMSYVPFFSPLIMFLRIGMSDPAWWEIAISLIILVVSILGLGWLSARIYRTGVMMYGKRPSFKELRKAMKAYKV